ncbi:LysR family transcriptional regulator [Shewanella sp. 3B26]|uniref:LysR family transcriptional regulator n=1 Tax=Shewanella zhuhaiensis TaxID=2919576 RepID=A0AAJ1BDS7_9GAMM|nr:LysR family transcriptional regulator [Shewanella zhuhaiensis]MCH4292901.1 LysR family transcriptional regulator [Shewanella zhuhaiensis]
MRLRTTLEQWLTLAEIERAGSIQAAAIKLNKSHTTLIYAVKKLEQQLNVPLLALQGRKAVLTEQGRLLLRRATPMLEQAQALEVVSAQLSAGIESQLTVSIDHLCNPDWLYEPMAAFLAQNATTSIQVVETSLSKTADVVAAGQVDIAIINLPVTNYPAEAFGVTTMVPVVSAEHPLAEKERLVMADLLTSCQIVIRDLGGVVGAGKEQNVGWLKSGQRITVDYFDQALRAVVKGMGFCRLPKHLVDANNDGALKVLNIDNADRYQVPLHVTLPKAELTGPAANQFYRLLLSAAKERLS